ncbi:PilZ domain-containing protein [Aliiglaciecola sp. CAU 1673]|uniref:PilZ domain-containing protein n=1 Tax=Aliiglaciecola sp. CAU 1673 TaxID=3032595 RepID=UPI0023DAE79E|nr:PilZ domain-containing protein [Aliiglaciecola sp. CAU 1673]MDF2177702.1 PilZ domain-containing protein [Aliiglaciecola sp. CAU 1673]
MLNKESSTNGVSVLAFSDEELIIKQYHKVVRALIPYQQQNKLLEGLNKFSGQLPGRIRAVIKKEVMRLTSPTDTPADNSAFAQFPVKKFKHFGVTMRLDRVGKEILEKESQLYQDRYTVGVLESVMSSESYQSQVRLAQQKKIVEAFTVQTQTLEDIEFGPDLAICPNYPVFCTHFEKGKSLPIAALSAFGITVETIRTPAYEDINEGEFSFVFPDVFGFCAKGTELRYRFKGISFNKDTSKFETQFALSPANDEKLIQRLGQYILNVQTQLPLQRDLEMERTMHNLERDRVLDNSPWLPIFLCKSPVGLRPTVALLTQANMKANPNLKSGRDLPCRQIMDKVLVEMKECDETFLLMGRINSKQGPVDIAATHRELIDRGLLGQFIRLLMDSGEFVVYHLRLRWVENRERVMAFGSHDIIPSDYPELEKMTHILYCRDVSSWIGKLQERSPKPFKVFPKSFINTDDKWQLDVLMEEAMDRRKEPRYTLNKAATVRTGLLTSYEAVVTDISACGMRLTLDDEDFMAPEEVKVTVPGLRLKGESYKVLSYNPRDKSLRLQLQVNKSKAAEFIQETVVRNTEYFSPRDIIRQQRNVHRFIWELAMRHVPAIAVLVAQNRFTIDRLRTVYGSQDSTDLKPFHSFQHQVSLHGFFADKKADKPKSSLLQDMLSNKRQEAHAVHCVRRDDGRTIYIEEQDFLYGHLRNQICDKVASDAIFACVSQINAVKCKDYTCLTTKRLAQLSKIDKGAYEKMKEIQKAYTHVLYITNISEFHNALLKAGIYPVKSMAVAS